MSIQKEDGYFLLVCDLCQNPEEKEFDMWSRAADAKKELGWKSKREGGGWIDVCPDCQE